MKHPNLAFIPTKAIDRVKTGERAEAYRRAMKVTQSDLARKMKMTQSNLSRLVAGRTRWTEKLLARYCRCVDKLAKMPKIVREL